MLQENDIRLRRLRFPEDVKLALRWYADPEVLRFSEGEGTAPYDTAMIRAMYQWMVDHGEAYIIETATGDGWTPIGDVLLSQQGLPIVIGDAAYRSKGIGRRVISLLIGRARQLGWTKLRVSKVFTTNARSRRLFEGLGFHMSGEGVDDFGHDYWTFELHLEITG